MSDGPHKSLNMRKDWKRVAKYADNRAFDLPQVAGAMEKALIQDFRKEVPRTVIGKLLGIFGDGQQLLFEDQRDDAVTELKRHSAGLPLCDLLIECAVQNSHQGLLGMKGILEAVRNALHERGLRGIREVEEHYLRGQNSPRSAGMRERLMEALDRAALEDCAHRVLRGAEDMPVRSSKQSGLDDGVWLS